jgi:serine/threonine protein kinase
MGQVWRATDTTLGRQVAIKILPDAFAADPERLARFEREAKTLASLNHPHIAAVYGFEKSSPSTGSGHAGSKRPTNTVLQARAGSRPVAPGYARGASDGGVGAEGVGPALGREFGDVPVRMGGDATEDIFQVREGSTRR